MENYVSKSITIKIAFNNQIGEYTAIKENGAFLRWDEQSIWDNTSANVHITSFKQIKPYRYLIAGSFEFMLEGRSKNHQFSGQFKDYYVIDEADPIRKAIWDKHIRAEIEATDKRAAEFYKKKKNKGRMPNF